MKIARLIVAVALVSCCHPAGDGPLTEMDAKRAADAHFREALPQVSLNRLTTSVEDAGEVWRITYSAPGSTGDPLVVEIQKNNGNITKGLKGPCYNKDLQCSYDLLEQNKSL
jgi:hypothetical protein